MYVCTSMCVYVCVHKLIVRRISPISLQVQNALALIKMATHRSVPGLSDMTTDLEVLHTLVYECKVEMTLER